MMSAVLQTLKTQNGRQTQIWLLALAALTSCLCLVTHVLASFDEESSEQGIFGAPLYSMELLFVAISTLVLLKLATDEHRENKRKRDEALHDGIIREHHNVLKGQAKALDAHAMVSISSSTGLLLDANENFRQFFGYGRADLKNASNITLYPGGEANPTHRAVAQAMHAKKTWQGKQTLKTINGEMVTVFTTVIPVIDDHGERTHSISIRTDITETEKSEGQKMLSQLMGDLQEEVYVYEVDTLALIYANKAACERCNWVSDDMTKLTIADSSSNFDTDAFWAHVQPLVGGKQETVTIKTLHDKGPVEITTRVVLAPSGKKVFVSVLRDMSEQQRIDKARLESLSEASHELRSPLTSIKGSLRLLEAGVIGPLPDKATELISVAHRNTDRLIGMVNNVLDYEKLKSGTMDVEKCPIDLNDVITKSVEMMAGYSDQHKVNIDLVLPEQPSLVSANADRLLQVVVNLLSNAAKHSPENGSVVVQVSGKSGAYRVSVKDNGPGVPDDARELIFESFGQVDALDGIKRHGTGLGLAICQKILRMHNTQMELSTSCGRGSEFYFDLPALDGQSGGQIDLDKCA